MHREREREGEAERIGGRGGQYIGEGGGGEGGGDRGEMRWGWREQLIHCIQLKLQYAQA